MTAQVREAAGGQPTPPGRAQPAGNPDDAEAYALLDLYLSFMDAGERDAWWQRARERGLDALLRDPPTPAVAWASLGPGDIVQAPQSPTSPEQYLRYRQAAIDVTNRLCETARAYPQAPVGPSVWEGRKPWRD